LNLLRLFPVWLVCAAAGGLYGWSSLGLPLAKAFGVSMAETGLVFSYSVVCFTLAVIFAPYLLQRASAVRCLIGFGLGAVAFLVIAVRADTYWMFVTGFSFGFAGMSGAIYITALSIAARSEHFRIATPVMVAGFGLGGAVFGPLWRVLDDAGWGLDGLWALILSLLASSVLLVFATENKANVDAFPGVAEVVPSPKASRTILFLLWALFAFGSFSGLMVLGLAARILDAAQVSLFLSTAALGGIALGNTLGRLSVAWVNRCRSPLIGLASAVSISGLGLLLTLLGGGGIELGVGLCLVALGYGVMASAVPSATQSIFGPDRFAALFAFIFTAWGIAGFIAPWIGGAIFDATGGFRDALVLSLLATSLSAVSILLLKRQVDRMDVMTTR